MTVSDAQFVRLYERHYRSVYAYCRRRVSSDHVDDVVAETFLVAWRRIESIPAGDQALAWLYAVAYRAVGHQWRGASRQARLESRLNGLGVSTVAPADEMLIVDHDSRRALEALSHLSSVEQEILRLTVWEELPHTEIAEVLGLSVDAVKKRFSRARKRLANELNRMERSRSKPPAVQKGGAW